MEAKPNMKVVAPMGAKEAYISNEGPTEAKPIVISNGGGEANSNSSQWWGATEANSSDTTTSRSPMEAMEANNK